MIEELLGLRLEIIVLHLLRILSAMFFIGAMGWCCWYVQAHKVRGVALAVSFLAISGAFTMGRFDFEMGRLAWHIRQIEADAGVEGWETRKHKHPEARRPMVLLEIGASAIVFFLFVVSLVQVRPWFGSWPTFAAYVSFALFMFGFSIGSIFWAGWKVEALPLPSP